MTIHVTPDGIITADLAHASGVSFSILELIKSEPIGYGLLGCGLTVARLANPDVRLHPFTEAKFCGHMMEWVDSYFTINVKGGEAN